MARIFKPIALFILIIFACFSLASAESPSHDAAVVTLLEGTAQLIAPKPAVPRPLSSGDLVAGDSEIQVGSGSRVELRFPDGTLLRLAAGTRFMVRQVEHDPATGRKNYGLDLLVGRVWARVKKLVTPNSRVTMNAATMVVGVRGTTFNVDLKADKSGLVKVYEGSVSIGPKAGAETVVQAGQQAALSAKGTVAKPKPFNPKTEKGEWQRWNRERDRAVEKAEPGRTSQGETASVASSGANAVSAAENAGAGAVSAGSSAAGAALSGATAVVAAGTAAETSGQNKEAPSAAGNSAEATQGESNVVVEIPRTQWCQCVRGLLNVEGGNVGACVKSGVSEEKLKIFRDRGEGGSRSKSVSFLLAFAGCTESENANVGSLSFAVEWQGLPPEAVQSAQGREKRLLPVSCETGGISTVEATLYRPDNTKLASAGPWRCSSPIGTLRQIPAGKGIRLVVTGKKASGAVLYRGEKTGITIAYQQTTALGVVPAPAFTPVPETPAPGSLLGTGRVHFSWSKPSGARSYQMQLSDNANFSPIITDRNSAIASSETGTPLASGAYFWRIKAKDGFNNTSEWSAPALVTVDTEPPVNTTADGFINRGASATNAGKVSLVISAIKKTGGVTGYFVSERSKKPAPGTTGWVAVRSTPTYSADIPYALSKRDGKKTVYVWFKDALGHISKVKDGSIVVDTRLIRTTITSHPSQTTNSTTADFAFTANKPSATFECRLDDGLFSACAGSKTYLVSEGVHTFTVQATDAAGTRELNPPGYSWTVDTLPPQTTITGHPDAATDVPSARFDFACTKPGSTFECRIDDGQFAACVSPQPYSGLAEGAHTFTVRATDPWGNVESNPPHYTWTINKALNTVITAHPPEESNSPEASFSFTSDYPAATFLCQLDEGSYAACTTPRNYSELSDGRHTFSVKAVDETGKEDASPAQYTWQVSLPEPPARPDISAVLDSLPIPDSPAFTMLGLTPDITPPASPRSLAVSFLTGFDVHGDYQSGIAVDLAPRLLFGQDLSLQQYRDSRTEQNLSGIQLSFGIAKGMMSSTDKATRLDAGIRWTVWNEGDYRMDDELSSCVQKMEAGEYVSLFGDDKAAYAAAVTPEARTRYCAEKTFKKNWNRSALDVGFAPSLIDASKDEGGLQSNGFGLWSSWSYGFEGVDQLHENSQLIARAEYRSGEMVPVDSFTDHWYLKQNQFSLGAKYLYRPSADFQLALFLQGLVLETKQESLDSHRSYVFSVGGEYPVAEGLWLVFNMAAQGDPGFLTIMLKGAFPEKNAVK